MAIAAHPAVVDVSTDDITYNEVDGINDFSFDPGVDILDTTDFKDTSGAKTKIVGLQDTSVEISGDYEDADTNGQNIIRTGFLNGTSVYIGFKYDGTDGYKVQCLVESFSITGSVDGKVEWSASLTSIGAVSTYS